MARSHCHEEEAIFAEAIEKKTPTSESRIWTKPVPATLTFRPESMACSRPTTTRTGFWTIPLRHLGETMDHASISEHPATIGPYKLREQVGEGGMGVVFVAEQEQPVRRKVALKIIKPGMDTKEVIARFEAERQALALMDHPNIARVLTPVARSPGDRTS